MPALSPVHSVIPLYWPLVNTLLFRVVWAFMTQCGCSELLWISPYTRYLKGLDVLWASTPARPDTAPAAPAAQQAIKAQLRPFHFAGCYFFLKTQHCSVSLQKKKQPTHSRQLKIKYDWTETENVCSRRKISEENPWQLYWGLILTFFQMCRALGANYWLFSSVACKWNFKMQAENYALQH